MTEKLDEVWTTYEQHDVLEGARVEELVALFQTAWWTRGRSQADVERMLAASHGQVAVTRRKDGALVGYARFLTDGVFKATVYDVIVDEAARGTGLGNALMDALLAHPRLAGVEHVELYCLPELIQFYSRWGFGTELGGVQLMRRER